MNKTLIITAMTGVLLLSGCAGSTNPFTNQPVTKADIGGLSGAVAGAWIGSNVGKGKGQIVGTALGALIGAGIGNSIGASLDRADMAYMQRTSQVSFESNPSGVSSQWNNPDSGNYGTITPTRTFQNAGQFCREFTQTVTIGGKMQEGYGTACRMPDGSWQIQS